MLLTYLSSSVNCCACLLLLSSHKSGVKISINQDEALTLNVSAIYLLLFILLMPILFHMNHQSVSYISYKQYQIVSDFPVVSAVNQFMLGFIKFKEYSKNITVHKIALGISTQNSFVLNETRCFLSFFHICFISKSFGNKIEFVNKLE